MTSIPAQPSDRTREATELDEALDFEPPCEVVLHVSRRPCNDPSVWFLTSSCPNCNGPTTKLLCDTHKEYWLSGAPIFCTGCNRRIVPVVFRLEHL